MSAPKKRFEVRKLDFGKGYVIFDTAAKRDVARTHSTYRRTAAERAAKMNAPRTTPGE